MASAAPEPENRIVADGEEIEEDQEQELEEGQEDQEQGLEEGQEDEEQGEEEMEEEAEQQEEERGESNVSYQLHDVQEPEAVDEP